MGSDQRIALIFLSKPAKIGQSQRLEERFRSRNGRSKERLGVVRPEKRRIEAVTRYCSQDLYRPN